MRLYWRVAHPFAVYLLDVCSRLDNTIPSRKRGGAGFVFPGGGPFVILEGSGLWHFLDFMANKLIRIYGRGHLHFITFTCYRRLPLLRSVRARNIFVEILGEVRDR